MKKLTFDELECTQSGSQPLHCHLEVKIDGSHLKEPYVLWENLIQGQTRDPAAPFTKNFYFDDRIEFSMELDDRHQLQEYSHEASDGDGTYVASFEYQGVWETEATYTVSDAGSVDPLQKSIDEFRDGIQVANNAGNWSPRWPNVSHSDVVDRAEQLVSSQEEAYGVDQADVGYCGVVSIMFASASVQPRRFVETCRSLYETGGFMTQTDREMSSGELRRSPVADDLHDLEWLYCGTLRESGNVDDAITASNLEEGTRMEEIKHWYADVLGFQNGGWYYQVGGDIGVEKQSWLDRAEVAVENGGAASLEIDRELATMAVTTDPEENASSWFNEGDHVVTMVEDIELRNEQGPGTDDDLIVFWVHDKAEYGGERDLIDIEWQYVEDYLFSVVVGWS